MRETLLKTQETPTKLSRFIRSWKARLGLPATILAVVLHYGSTILDWIGRGQLAADLWTKMQPWLPTVVKWSDPVILLGGVVLVFSAVRDLKNPKNLHSLPSLPDKSESDEKLSRREEKSEPHLPESWIDLYNERKRLQDDLDAAESSPKPPDIPFEQLTVRRMTAAEMHEQDEKRRKVERTKRELQLVDERLELFSQVGKPPTRLIQTGEMFSPEEKERQRKLAGISSTSPKDSDPLVYVEFLDKRNEMARRTPFVLHNRGKGVAHKILIKPVNLNVGSAQFAEVDTLDGGARCEVNPEIAKAGALLKYDFLNLVRSEASLNGKASDHDFLVAMSVTYWDVTGNREFELSFDFYYSPWNNLLFADSDILKKVKKFYEIRNTKIRVVADHERALLTS